MDESPEDLNNSQGVKNNSQGAKRKGKAAVKADSAKAAPEATSAKAPKTAPDEEDESYTVSEAARLIGIEPHTLRRLESRGLITSPTRDRRGRRYTRQDVEHIRDQYGTRRRREAYTIAVVNQKGGVGKCLGKGTPVLMFDGRVKKVEDVQVGDLLMGPDSTGRTVLSLARGTAPLYRIVPVKGDPYVVNEDHILSLKAHSGVRGELRGRGGETIHISVRDYLTKTAAFRRNTVGWRTGVTFPSQEIFVEPYFVGLWLGDGDVNSPRITTKDAEVVGYLEEYAARLGLVVHPVRIKGDRCPMYDLTKGHFAREHNPLLDRMRAHHLIGFKHIPQVYKANDRKARLELLAGIVDSDGSLSQGCYDLTLKSQVLAEDVAFVARSCGFAAYIKPCQKSWSQNGVILGTGDYFRLTISGEISEIPCKLPRKQACPRKQGENVLHTGIQVEPIGEGEYYGFTLDGDRQFLLGDFTVTHNTTTCVNLAGALAIGGNRVLVIDFDPQVNATSTLGISWRDVEFSIADVLSSGPDGQTRRLMDIITPLPHHPNLFLAPSSIKLAYVEMSLINRPGRDTRLDSAIETIRREYDFILVDCPPTLGMLTFNGMTAADGIIVPVDESLALQGAGQLLATRRECADIGRRRVSLLGALLTRQRTSTAAAEVIEELTREIFGTRVFKTKVPERVAIANSTGMGRPLVFTDAREADTFFSLAEEVEELVHAGK